MAAVRFVHPLLILATARTVRALWSLRTAGTGERSEARARTERSRAAPESPPPLLRSLSQISTDSGPSIFDLVPQRHRISSRSTSSTSEASSSNSTTPARAAPSPPSTGATTATTATGKWAWLEHSHVRLSSAIALLLVFGGHLFPALARSVMTLEDPLTVEADPSLFSYVSFSLVFSQLFYILCAALFPTADSVSPLLRAFALASQVFLDPLCGLNLWYVVLLMLCMDMVALGVCITVTSLFVHVSSWGTFATTSTKDAKRYNKVQARLAKAQRELRRWNTRAADNSTLMNGLEKEISFRLNSILGILVLMGQDPDLPEKVKLWSQSIENSLESLLPTISMSSNLFNAKFGHHSQGHTLFDLRDLVEASAADTVRKFHTDSSSKSKAALVFDVATFLDPSLSNLYLGDVDSFRKILTTFIENAMQVSSSGGVFVTVEPSKFGVRNISADRFESASIELGGNTVVVDNDDDLELYVLGDEEDADPGRQFLTISVHDDGPGLPHEEIPLVFFNPFQKTGFKLSLALAAALTSQIGAKILVTSNPETKGCIFSLVMSLHRSMVEVPEPPSTRTGRVMVIESRQRTRDHLGDILARAGYHVTKWSHWVDGVSELRHSALLDRPYDVVFIGVGHAAFKSDETIRLLKGDRAAANVKLVAVRSHQEMIETNPDIRRLISGTVAAPIVSARVLPLLSKLVSEDSHRRRLSSSHDISSDDETCSTDGSDDSRKLRILLAEDNRMYAHAFTRIITSDKHDCDVAANGKLAVQAAEKKRYDVMFMDLNMPVMGGHEATSLIREMEATRRLPHTPIVALTADNDDATREKCLRSGFDDFLGKPVKREELLEFLRNFNPRRRDSSSMGSSVRTPRMRPLRPQLLASISEEFEEASEAQHLGRGCALTMSNAVIVDDDAVFREVVIGVLARLEINAHGMRFDELGQLPSELDLDFIVIGVEKDVRVVRQLQQLSRGGSPVPIIALIGMNESREKWSDAGCSAVMTKPLDFVAFAQLAASQVSES